MITQVICDTLHCMMYAEELIDWLQSNQVSNIIYIANSINCMVALMAAYKAPNLFHKIILASGAPSLHPGTDLLSKKELNDEGLEALYRNILHKHQMTEHTGIARTTVQLWDVLYDAMQKMSNENAFCLFKLLYKADCRPLLSELSTPVMILQVSNDAFATHEAGYYMYRNITNSQLVKILSKGQLPQLDTPEEILLSLRFFVSNSF